MIINLQETKNKNKQDQLATRSAVGFSIARPSSEEKGTFQVATGVFERDLSDTTSHAAEPIKSLDDICKVQNYMLENGMYRDNLLFTCGINFGLRISDLLKLQVGHLLNAEGNTYNDRIVLNEQKTGKRRVVYMNDAVMDAADLYFGDLVVRGITPDLNDFLFTNLSSNAKATAEYREAYSPVLTSRSVERILKSVINDKCGLDIHASTHCLRKTFAYHVIMTAKDRPRAVEFLQKMFGHSSQAITLRYAGITDEEIMKTYQELNLGSDRSKARREWDVSRSSGYKVSGRKPASGE